MQRFLKTTILALIVIGGLWILFSQQQIRQAGGLAAFLQQRVDNLSASLQPAQKSAAPTGFQASFFNQFAPRRLNQPSNPSSTAPAGFNTNQPAASQATPPTTGTPGRQPGTIRVASFKLNANATKVSGSHDFQVLTHLCSQFDVIAFQEIDHRGRIWLDQFTRQVAIETNGAVQFHAITDQTNVAPGQPQFAIVYNTNTLELDYSQWYTVSDPHQLLTRQPLVGWFRARGVPQQEAFTFTLANVQLDHKRPDLELSYIGELFRAIRQDGRREDDVIIVGNFNSGDRGLSPLRKRAGLTWVVFDTPTATDKQSQFDNLVFAQNATVEFTGQGGVVDFLAAYNLDFDQAMRISDHLPIWAEFSVFEGPYRRVPTLRQAGR